VGLLIEARWRQIRWSLLVWTIVGTAFAWFTATMKVNSTISTAPHVPWTLAVIPAALAGRLFSSRGDAGVAVWQRSLPLPSGCSFLIDCGLGLAATVAGTLILAAEWYGLFPLMVPPGFLLVTPAAHEWRYAVALLFLTFAASAYFATAFTQGAAARQAGVAGFFAATELSLACWTLSSGIRVVVVSVAALSGLAGAYRLYRRRGIEDEEGRLLGRHDAVDVIWILPGQICFVIVPLAFLVYEAVNDPAPSLSVATAVLLCGVWLAFGVLALPWGVRELRRHGEKGWKRIAVLALIATGFGVFLWRAVRSRGRRVACASCSRERVENLSTCPSCGAGAVRATRIPLLRRQLLPSTPWGIVAATFVYVIGGSCVLGGQRYVHAFDVRSSLPGVEVALEDGRAQDTVLRGWQLGPRRGRWYGNWRSRQTAYLETQEATDTVSVDAFRAAPVDDSAPDLAPFADCLSTALSPTRFVRVSCNGFPCRIIRAQGEASTSNFVVGVELVLTVECPALQEQAKTLVERARTGGVSEADVRASSEQGLSMLIYLAREYHVARTEREAILRLLDDVVAARYGPRPGPKDQGSILSDIDEAYANAFRDSNWMMPKEAGLEWGFPLARGLALVANEIPDELESRIRGGNAFVAMAAGMAGVDSCYSACEELFTSVESWSTEAYLAGFAMLALRPCEAFDRLAPVAESGFGDDLVLLVGLCGDPRAASWLDRRAQPDEYESPHEAWSRERIQALKEHSSGATLLQALY
jgi:hypothetical protein